MGTDVRENTPTKDSTCETNFDKIEAVPGHKKRPASAQTDDGANPTCKEVRLMPTLVPLPTDTQSVDRPEMVRQYLQLTRVQMEQAVRNRDLYAKLAKSYGLTNKAIGDELGLTEARVRQILVGAE